MTTRSRDRERGATFGTGFAAGLLLATLAVTPAPIEGAVGQEAAPDPGAKESATTPWKSAERDANGDADGDGVANSRDLCPRTLPRPASRKSEPDAAGRRGCTSAQVLAFSDLLLERPHARLQEAIDFLEPSRELEETRRALKNGLASLQSSIELLHSGEPCAGAKAYGDAVGSIRVAEELLGETIPRMQAKLEQEELATEQTTRDHVGVGTSRLSGLLIAHGRVAEALRAAVYVEDVVAAPCQAVDSEFTARGVVDEIDDAASLMRLQDGRVFHYGPGSRRAARGMSIQSDAVGFTDGSEMARDPQPLGDIGPAEAGDPDVATVRCLDLRVAPIQRFPPIFSGPFTLHQPLAYVHGPWLWLEKGMRLAAISRNVCPGNIGLTLPRYSLKIDLTYKSVLGQTKHRTLASDLGTAGEPVPFPWDISASETAFLTVTEQRWTCHLTPQLNVTCNKVSDLVTIPNQWLWVRPDGAYASVTYAQTVFDLEDNDQTGFRPTHVASVSLHGQQVVASTPPFKAEGCLAFGNATTCDTDNVADISWHDFGIYNHDFYDPDDLFPLLYNGVDHPAGLRWPYVTGTNNFHEFWYSAQLPTLVRDAVDLCPDDPHSFYRYPFYPGSEAGWFMTHGNWQPDGSGHCGFDPFETCLQRYAFDFGCNEGTEVRAARGGLVTLVKSTSTANQWDCYHNSQPGCDNGNYVYIRHQDGTYASYWHFQGYTITVQPGDMVHRGDPIGQCGNTGNSGGPHLHFHVQDCGTIDCGFSRLVRFQAADQVCHTSQNYEWFSSNNDPSVW